MVNKRKTKEFKMEEISTVKTNKGINTLHNEGGVQSKVNSSIRKLMSKTLKM